MLNGEISMFDILNPRQTVLISCSGNDVLMGKEVVKDNITPTDCHMPCSFDPMYYAIALHKERYSIKLIRESKMFIVNFMPYEKESEVANAGKKFGGHIEKFDEVFLTKEESDTLDCVRVKEALAYIECRVIEETVVGDHVMFIAKVTHSYEKNKGKRLFHLKGGEFTTTV